jgi:glycosyltransferase involved in cell wall biosynthesis
LKTIKVALLTKYGDLAASARQRFEQYQPFLEDAGFEVMKYPLFNNIYLKKFYDSGKRDFGQVLIGYLHRLKWLMSKPDVDLIWLHCELFPYLPGLFEKIATLPRKPIIYDYDDAIFHNYDINSKWYVRKFFGQKLHYTIGAAKIAFCGNNYLANYARPLCSRIEVVPTVVNTDVLYPKAIEKHKDSPIKIGWIGSPTTWHYFEKKLPMMKRLASAENGNLFVMGASKNITNTHSLLNFVEWSEAGEVPFLQSLDIGVMPLDNSPWAKGKCGYKIIQYMACGIPVVASPIGVNQDIIDHGINGFLVETDEEWYSAITKLMKDKDLRQKMGNSGRKKVENQYSLKVWGPRVSRILLSSIEEKVNL